MSNTKPDAVDTILGITPGAPLDVLRHRRPITRDNTQSSYLALFHAEQVEDASLTERTAVAVFVALLHGNQAAAVFYSQALEESDTNPGLAASLHEAAAAGAAQGPYGEYREPGLRSEDRPGLRWTAAPNLAEALGTRLVAALEHAHLLVFRPREASPDALDALVRAGWSTTGIVTLSQLVAFLTYQLRVIAGLELLAGDTAQHEAGAAASADVEGAQTVRINA
ncbi:CMD domain protein [Paenarthrobacter sp. NPDC092416]|uniref:CMD domain protein n=1 Tax=Paenarthrobacter sp. NPDC092416 TaxID=3364386 RepID=UPI0037FD0966